MRFSQCEILFPPSYKVFIIYSGFLPTSVIKFSNLLSLIDSISKPVSLIFSDKFFTAWVVVWVIMKVIIIRGKRIRKLNILFAMFLGLASSATKRRPPGFSILFTSLKV